MSGRKCSHHSALTVRQTCVLAAAVGAVQQGCSIAVHPYGNDTSFKYNIAINSTVFSFEASFQTKYFLYQTFTPCRLSKKKIKINVCKTSAACSFMENGVLMQMSQVVTTPVTANPQLSSFAYHSWQIRCRAEVFGLR